MYLQVLLQFFILHVKSLILFFVVVGIFFVVAIFMMLI
jgi:hypothetical protein